MEDYKILSEMSASVLAGMVNELREKGYEPLGGVAVVLVPGIGRQFFQAMLKSK